LRVEEGSLYPALHRMEQDGWINAEWGDVSEHRRARYYRLTATGRKQLAEEEKNRTRLTQAVATVLQFAHEIRKAKELISKVPAFPPQGLVSDQSTRARPDFITMSVPSTRVISIAVMNGSGACW